MNTDNAYPALFIKAVHHVLRAEGGYVNNANDAGGETNYGISKRQYPHVDIKHLSLDDAIDIYYRDYWLQYDCDKLPPAYAVFLFDSVVNHRPKTAVKFLQKAFNVTVDGFLGPRTIAALNRLSENTEHTQEQLILALAFRAVFYHDITVNNPKQEVFILGWHKRLFTLHRYILKEIINVD